MLRKGEILDTSAMFGQAFAIIDSGTGHREPARIQCSHLLSLEQYRRLRNTPLKEVAHPQPGLGDEYPDAPWEMHWQKSRQLPPTAERQQQLMTLSTMLQGKEAVERGEQRPAGLS